jgi:hypothetical protein
LPTQGSSSFDISLVILVQNFMGNMSSEEYSTLFLPLRTPQYVFTPHTRRNNSHNQLLIRRWYTWCIANMPLHVLVPSCFESPFLCFPVCNPVPLARPGCPHLFSSSPIPSSAHVLLALTARCHMRQISQHCRPLFSPAGMQMRACGSIWTLFFFIQGGFFFTSATERRGRTGRIR